MNQPRASVTFVRTLPPGECQRRLDAVFDLLLSLDVSEMNTANSGDQATNQSPGAAATAGAAKADVSQG